jgi:hypothetical protein
MKGKSASTSEIKRYCSYDGHRDRALHKRSISNDSDESKSNNKEQQQGGDDTNSSTDSENDKTFLGTTGSVSLAYSTSIKQMQNEHDVYRRRPARGVTREEKQSESLERKQSRARSRSRGPSSIASSAAKLGKGLFSGRLRSKSRSRVESSDRDKSDKQESYLRRRTRSKSRGREKETIETETKEGGKLSRTRASSKVRARTRSKSRVNSTSRASRARSNSRARSKNRTRGKSVKSSKSTMSDPAASKRRSSSKKRSASVDPRNKGRKEGNSYSGPVGSLQPTTRPPPSPLPSSGGKLPPSLQLPSLQPFVSDGTSLESDSIDSMADMKNSPAPKNLLEDSSASTKSSLRLPLVGRVVARSDSYKSSESKSTTQSINKTRSLPPNLPLSPGKNVKTQSANSRRRTASKTNFTTIASNFPPSPVSAKNENPIVKTDATKPEAPTREWRKDLTKSLTEYDSDSCAADTFEHLWGKNTAHTRANDDETHGRDETTTTKDEEPLIGNSNGNVNVNVNGNDNDNDNGNGNGNGADNILFAKGFENSLRENNSRYDEQHYESECQIKAFTDQVTSLENQLESKEADLTVVERQLKASFQDGERIQRTSEITIRELNDQIKARGKQIETLQRQLDVAYGENSQEMYEAELKIKAFRETVDSMQESLDEKIAEIDKLKRKLDKADNVYQNNDADFQLHDFREQVSALQDALDVKDIRFIEMQGRVDEAECENKILMEEFEELLQEKNAAEARAIAIAGGDDGTTDARLRINELEKELEDATNVAKLQLDELDEEVAELLEKIKAERLESATKIKTRDATIDELTTKLRKYEAVRTPSLQSFAFQPSMHTTKHSSKHSAAASAPISSNDSVGTENSRCSFAAASGTASFAGVPFVLTDNIASETPAINTDDVTDIESAKQKVYEARADATSVRESLEISTKRCAELTIANELLARRNTELVDTTRERDELKDNVRDWTAQTYQWKRRAEDAESKLYKLTVTDGSEPENDENVDHQGMMIRAAMDNRSGRGSGRGITDKSEKRSGWSLFSRTANSNSNSAHTSNAYNNDTIATSDGDVAAEAKEVQISELNKMVAKLRSDIFQMTTSHKEETYLSKKRVNELVCENEALVLKNGTLEQLSRFHSDH